MILKIFSFPTEIQLKKENIHVIEIEDQLLFRKIIETLNLQINNQETEEKVWLYDQKYKEISYQKVDIIFDYLNMFSSINLVKPLEKLIEKDYDEHKDQIIENINIDLNLLATTLLCDLDINLSYQERYSLSDLLKLLKVKIVEEETILDNLFLLIDYFSMFKEDDILFLINLKQFLIEEELKEFYNYIQIKQVTVVLLEGRASDKLLIKEQKLTIDQTFDDHYRVNSTEI